MSSSPLVAGVDSSTQSCKVVVCDAATGEVVRAGRGGHPEGTEIVPAPGEHVALGAARQAAWVLAGGDEPPSWRRPGAVDLDPPQPWGNDIRTAYSSLRKGLHP